MIGTSLWVCSDFFWAFVMLAKRSVLVLLLTLKYLVLMGEVRVEDGFLKVPLGLVMDFRAIC